MATSEVEIANNALYLLGAKPITSFDEGSDRANIMGALYPITRDATLRAHPWRFARELFGNVAKLAATPVWKWGFQYQLSSNPYVLRVLEVDGDREGKTWQVYGRKILTDIGDTINYEAVIRVTDTLTFDSCYEDALTFRLAAAAAMPITENRTVLEAMLGAYKDKMAEARTISSQEGYPEDGDAGAVLLNARLAAGDLTSWRKIKRV